MSKWGKKAKESAREVDEGNAMGLTQAFAPIEDDDLLAKRGRHARHAADEGNAMGLTQAFAPVDVDGFSEDASRADDEVFEGDAWMPDDEAWSEYAYEKSLAGFDVEPEGEFEPAGEDAAGQGAAPEAEGESDDLPPAPAVGALEPAPEKRAKRGRHAKHAVVVSDGGDEADGLDDAEGDASEERLSVANGTQRAESDEVPAYLRKSRRMRRILTIIIALLVVLLVAGGVFAWQRFGAEADSARQQAQTQEGATNIKGADASDAAASSSVKKTSAPDLVSLMGLTRDEAVEALQHGAQVSDTSELNEEGNDVKTEVRVALTSEPSDTRTGTPTVYLGLDEEGLVIQAGYSASTSSLGYGSLSFSDAVENEHIVEKTLAEVGLSIEEGAVTLPDDKAEYSTYGSDGKTLVKEYCPFEGEALAGGASHEWSAVLSYDYNMANATGNLADTVRLIYVYVNA